MRHFKQTILILLLCLSSISAFAQPDKTLTLTISNTSTGIMNAYFEFLKTAYNEIGYNVTLKKLSDKRSYASADNGMVDGLVLTSRTILKTHKNLIAVDIPLTKIELVAYSITKDFKVEAENIESFKPYKIGILRGYHLVNKLTHNMNRQIVDNYDSLFSILQIGRVDIVIILKTEAQRFLNANPQFKDVKELKPPIYALPLYHLLNKRHEALAQKIKPIIERLLKENLLEELRKPYLK